MATVEIVKIERQADNELEVTIDARTSVGRIQLPVRFRDRGSLELNEIRAFEQALVIVEEIASALRLRLGSSLVVPPVLREEK